MKFTILVENTSNSDLIAEHGLSFLIEFYDKKILLDAGTTDAFYENAKCMNLSLADLDAAVLSHGHYDHSGGLKFLFERHKNIMCYAQKSAFGSYFSGSGGLHEICIPEEVRRYKNRFILVEGFKEILDGVFLVPHTTANLHSIGLKSKLYKMDSGEMIPDDFSHEQSLVLDTLKGLVIFNSCSHGGVLNIVNEVKTSFPEKPIYAYIGGFHMKGKRNGQEICAFSAQELNELCEKIKNEKISRIYTGHCTGAIGLKELKLRLGDTVQELTTGLRIEI